MKLGKLSRRLGTIALVGGLAMAILVLSAALAAAGGARVFVAVRVGGPVFVHHPFFVHRPFVRTPFVPFVVTPFAVNRLTVVSTTVFSSRPVVFVPPARFVFPRAFVRPPFVPVVVTPVGVDRVTVVSSTSTISPTRAVVIDPPTPAASNRPGSFMPSMRGIPGRGSQ